MYRIIFCWYLSYSIFVETLSDLSATTDLFIRSEIFELSPFDVPVLVLRSILDHAVSVISVVVVVGYFLSRSLLVDLLKKLLIMCHS